MDAAGQGAACPVCGRAGNPADANFCSGCGGALRGPPCVSCEEPSRPGDRFCIQCGTALGEPPRAQRWASRSVWIPWGIVGVMGLGIIVFLVLDSSTGGRDLTLAPPGTPVNVGALGPTSSVDLGSMTPREAAERLFNRVMTAVEAGDSVEAQMFLPMAIASYGRIGQLTLDDHFHLSLLHGAAGDGASALTVAESGLAVRSTHLLCLAAAAGGALLLGEIDQATGYYQRFVDVYEEERASGLEEYGTGPLGHAALLPVLLEEARGHLASVGAGPP